MYLVGVRGAADSKSIDFFVKFSKDLIALPVKGSALHYCHDNPVMKPVMALVQMTAGKDYRVRSRTHYGETRLITYYVLLQCQCTYMRIYIHI
jgi:hypothetical protein